ncbi:MAG: DUF3768 domain-containing protein [Bdellovibrionaceae bacterium]|nr:DUF3768 domain-containing protein [Pseudobdellovibrionaceae bacterium]
MSTKDRNDLLRTTLQQDAKNRIVLTASVNESPNREAIIEAVRSFDDFNKHNDPYEEHDFGFVMVGQTKYFFKFDYYDLNFEYGANPEEEDYALVLTIMESGEN